MEHDPTSLIFCSSRGKSTHHKLVTLIDGDRDVAVDSDGHSAGLLNHWIIYGCKGCGSLTLLDGVASDLHDDEEGDEEPSPELIEEWSRFYPVDPKRFLRARTLHEVPDRLKALYYEIRQCYMNRLDILCAVGLRSLMEGICNHIELGGKYDNLKKKIGNLSRLGLSPSDVEALNGFRFMDNDAAHELIAPDPKDLQLATETIEELMVNIYDLDQKLNLLYRRHGPPPDFLLPGDIAVANGPD